MDVKEILKHVDHTLLKQTATWEDIKQICDDGIKYGCASVCIPQTYVNHAAHYVAEQQHYGFGQLPICTVIGFPNGYSTTAVKAFEAADAVAKGADEIDMVINIGAAKDGDWATVEQDIAAVKAACAPAKLKVIIETCLLTDEEKNRDVSCGHPVPGQTISKPPRAFPRPAPPSTMWSCLPPMWGRM